MIPSIFSVFGVPEFVLTDNGKQFIGEKFQAMLNSYGIKHLRTPNYCPQANASERVNRSILSAIRAYIKEDQGDWDKHIHEIASSLRSSIHQAIQMSPFQALFGLNMIQHGTHYNLLRKLHSLNDPCEIEPILLNNKMRFIHERLRENLRKAYLRYEKHYNLRSKQIIFTPGQTVYRRNFILSDRNKKLNMPQVFEMPHKRMCWRSSLFNRRY